MGRSFSSDLRERIARDISQGHSCRATARKFAVSVSTAIRLGVKVRDGEDLSAHKRGRKEGTGKLAPFAAFLVEHVEARPDITLRELADALNDAHGITAALSSIWNALDRAGFTYKKIAYGVRNWQRRCP